MALKAWLVRPSIWIKLNDEKEIKGKREKEKEEVDEQLIYFGLIYECIIGKQVLQIYKT